MIIHEIFIQGISGLTRQIAIQPRRVEKNDADVLSETVNLDGAVEPESIYKCVRALVFPSQSSKRVEYLFANGENPRAGIVFSDKGKVARCVRAAHPDTIMLQVEGERDGQRIWETLAKGAQQVDEVFGKSFARPSFESFESFADWSDPNLFYQPSDTEAAIEEAIDNDLSINSLMIMYEDAYSYEQAQAQVGRLSEKLMRRTVEPPAVPGQRDPELEINARHKAALEQSINDLMIEIGQLGLGSISQKEFEDVQDAESVVATTSREIRRLEELQNELQMRLRDKTIRPWLTNPLFWISFIVGLSCLVATFFVPSDFNWVCLFSIIFVAIATSIIFRSTGTLGDQAGTFKKIQSVEKRLAKEYEIYASARQKLGHFLMSVESSGVAEVAHKFETRQQLVTDLAQRQLELKEFLDAVGRKGLPIHDVQLNPNRNPNATLIHELEIARGTLEVVEKPEYSAKTIAREMVKHGFDPSGFNVDELEQENLQHQESALLIQAEKIGCLQGGQLIPEVEEIWNRLLHRFMHNNLYFCVQGQRVEISEEKSTKASSPRWKSERPNVFRWVLFSLNCALVEFAAERNGNVLLPTTIFCLHPDALKREDDRRRLKRIIGGTRTTSWVLFQPGN